MSTRAVKILVATLLVGALAASVPEISSSFDPDEPSLPVSSPVAGVAGTSSTDLTPCGTHAAEVLAMTAGAVAQRIYAGETSGPETRSDQRQVERFAPLLRAIESGETAAIDTAVTSLVFSHTHIVRLRVTRGSQVLSDVGGPYILAPASGTLRSHGHSLAHYVLSVQDDLGYVKLVTRFLGAPLVMRTDSGQVPIEGMLSPGPPTIPDHGPVEYHRAGYQAFSFNAEAYPSGRLRISLLLPVDSSLAAESCAAIKTAEMGAVARDISHRFTLSRSNFSEYLSLAAKLTHAVMFVRSGSHTLAASTHRPAPARLPSSGSVSYRGTDYEVASFSTHTSAGTVRVYSLVAP
jgi:hypothetical protein